MEYYANWKPWCHTDEFAEQKDSNYEIKLFSKRTIKDATCKKYIWSTLNNASSAKIESVLLTIHRTRFWKITIRLRLVGQVELTQLCNKVVGTNGPQKNILISSAKRMASKRSDR